MEMEYTIGTQGICLGVIIDPQSFVNPPRLAAGDVKSGGRFQEIAEKDSEFHIASNDVGFNCLVNHLKKIGRKCKKISTKTTNMPKRDQTILSGCASAVVLQL